MTEGLEPDINVCDWVLNSTGPTSLSRALEHTLLCTHLLIAYHQLQFSFAKGMTDSDANRARLVGKNLRRAILCAMWSYNACGGMPASEARGMSLKGRSCMRESLEVSLVF